MPCPFMSVTGPFRVMAPPATFMMSTAWPAVLAIAPLYVRVTVPPLTRSAPPVAAVTALAGLV